jgi:hypothetical protein
VLQLGSSTKRKLEECLKHAFVVEWTRKDAPSMVDFHFTNSQEARRLEGILAAILPDFIPTPIAKRQRPTNGFGKALNVTTVELYPSPADYERLKDILGMVGSRQRRSIPSAYSLININIDTPKKPILQIDNNTESLTIEITVTDFKKLDEETQLLFTKYENENKYFTPVKSPASQNYFKQFTSIEDDLLRWMTRRGQAK